MSIIQKNDLLVISEVQVSKTKKLLNHQALNFIPLIFAVVKRHPVVEDAGGFCAVVLFLQCLQEVADRHVRVYRNLNWRVFTCSGDYKHFVLFLLGQPRIFSK